MAESKRICSVKGCDKPTGVPGTARGWCGMHYARWKAHGDPSVTKKVANGQAVSFLRRAISYQGDECLIWPFARDAHGRGVVCVEGKTRKVSRVVCESVHGPAPSKRHQGAHSCGNGHIGCVNPKHLRWATISENQMDRVEHGTSNRGERQGRSKLTEAQVREIRRLANTMEASKIAKMFAVTDGNVRHIVARRSWGWLE